MRKAFARGIALGGILALVTLGEGAIRIRFSDFFVNKDTYQAGIGMEPKLQLSPKLQELHGKEVELFGFMDSALPPDGAFFLLLKEPLDVCPFHAYAFDWAAIATVFTQKGGTPYLGGPIRVIGRLDVGRRRDETGLISYVRIYDARVMRAR